MNVIDELKWRIGIEQVSDEKLFEIVEKESITLYVGCDPTAKSLHIGNLFAVLPLVYFQKAGHRPIALVGGATGMIGDPSGKTKERKLLTREIIAENVEGIKKQLEKFLDFTPGKYQARIVNNADWLACFNILDFLRDVGKHFRIGEMLSRETVKKRLESSEGMSFTEFSYPLLQGYDFYHLYREYGCILQIGGSDQWGNIVSGIDLARKIAGASLYGMTFPLLLSSSGQKFGKSEEGTIWLDPDMTSPYKFYQFWMNVEDADVVRMLKVFTALSRDEIAELERKTLEKPEAREAQRVLAFEVTAFIHGKEAALSARKVSRAVFDGSIGELDEKDIKMLSGELPTFKINKERLIKGEKLPFLLRDSGIVKSTGEARRLIQGGGIYVNDEKFPDAEKTLGLDSLISGKYLFVRIGKNRYHLMEAE